MDDHIEQAIREMSLQIEKAANNLKEKLLNGASASRKSIGMMGERSLVEICRVLRDNRKLRTNHFPASLFHEPAWEILMTLYLARFEHKTMYVKSLVIGADAPVATSQRWIEHLANIGLVHRREDAADRRRTEVSLSDDGLNAMDSYLREVSARG